MSDKNVTSPVFGGDEDDAKWVLTHINRYLLYDDECDVYEYADNKPYVAGRTAGRRGRHFDLNTMVDLRDALCRRGQPG